MPIIDLAFPTDHPTAAGHFPGNPIIPGALLLAEVLAGIAAHLGLPLPPREIKSAKFFSPARPGDRLLIDYTQAASGQIKFTCAVDGRTVLAGEVKCAQSAAT